MSKKSENPSIKSIILEFVEKLRENENELLEIKERRKDLFNEYKDQLDTKAIKAALQIVKIRVNVADQTALDNILNTLEERLGGYISSDEDDA